MTSPYDPKTPLYQGQALAGQQTAQPAPNAGFHFLEAAGHAVLAGVRFFGGDDDAAEQEEQPSRRRPRSRTPRVGGGTCCRAKRPEKP